jgi:outer membrane receptor protein involved in Fe transport
MIDQATQNFIKFKVEGYRKLYNNLILATQTNNGVIYSRRNDATGTAYGIDGCITYSQPGLYGWISYGYLVGSQTLVHDTIGHSFPLNTDQRHTLAATCEFELGSRWTMNVRFAYGSGYPYTPSYAVFNRNKQYWTWMQGSPNSDYLPAYERCDVRITKDFEIFGKSTSVYLDVSNLFDAANVQAYRYQIDLNGNPYREDVKLWPILPTLGMSIRF